MRTTKAETNVRGCAGDMSLRWAHILEGKFIRVMDKLLYDYVTTAISLSIILSYLLSIELKIMSQLQFIL